MITILMATYNGARFVAAQIDSLLLQTEQRFMLHIQDDCSTDETYAILCDYAANYPEKSLSTNARKIATAQNGTFWI